MNSKRSPWHWWVFSLLLFSLTLNATETRHIHLLKILDNENQDYIIREGCRSIDFAMQQEVELLANELGVLNVIEYNISGKEFSLERLDEVLTYDMEYQERDIVILLYVGHGYRDGATLGPYPRLYFKGYEKSVNLSDLQERILDKKPSMLLSIIIACNVTIQDRSEPPPYISINDSPDMVALASKNGVRNSAYRQLFADQENYTKTIDLFSAAEEFYTFIGADGGIFFSEIMYTLQEVATGRSLAGWDEICKTVADRTVTRSSRKGLQQRPHCQYSVRLNPIEVSVPAERRFLRPNACKVMLRDLRRAQRQELKDLRRRHRDNIRDARDDGQDRNQRRLLAQTQRVDLENLKLQHETAYQRRLQQCQ